MEGMINAPEFPLSFETKQAIFQGFFSYSIDIYPPSGIINLVQLLKAPDVTRGTVECALQKQLSSSKHELDDSDEVIGDAINLGTRLILMISTEALRGAGHSLTISGEEKLCWNRDESLASMMEKRFAPPKDGSSEGNVKLEKIFNARNLERIGGIEIRWTTNLADHLRMRDDDTAVEIFYYASFLAFHRDSPNTLLPSSLIHETLQTLALLLPEHDPATTSWYARQASYQSKRRNPLLDPLARENSQLKASARQISKFPHRNERLTVLKEVFDEAEPRGIRQWWWDRRRRVQWYTFWVAAVVLVLTVVFGVVQSVEGALQVWLAWKALES